MRGWIRSDLERVTEAERAGLQEAANQMRWLTQGLEVSVPRLYWNQARMARMLGESVASAQRMHVPLRRPVTVQ